jgi:hypothetical protein
MSHCSSRPDSHAHAVASGPSPHDDPDTATVIPAACTVAYTDTVHSGATYQTANVLEECTANSVGGLYYSIGPVALPGLLEVPLNELGNNSYGIGIAVAIYGSSSSSGPSCIAATSPDANWVALLSYQVSADDVASNRTFLVRVGVVDDGSGDAVFREAFHLTVRFHCYIPSPNDDPSTAALAVPSPGSVCPTYPMYTVPAFSTYQVANVLGSCGASIAGVHFSIGPFSTTGILEVQTRGPCTCTDQWCNCEWPDSQTVVALYDRSSHTCITSSDAPGGIMHTMTDLAYQITEDDVSGARTFLVKVGLWRDMRHGQAWYGDTEAFAQDMNIQFVVQCPTPPSTNNDSPDTALALDTSDICSREVGIPGIARGTT